MSRRRNRHEAPWPHVRLHRASRMLGVDPDWLKGVVSQRSDQLRAVTYVNGRGARIWLLNVEDVQAMQRKTRESD